MTKKRNIIAKLTAARNILEQCEEIQRKLMLNYIDFRKKDLRQCPS